MSGSPGRHHTNIWIDVNVSNKQITAFSNGRALWAPTAEGSPTNESDGRTPVDAMKLYWRNSF